MSGKGRPAVPP